MNAEFSLEDLIRCIPAALLIVHKNGQITVSNAMAQSILGYSELQLNKNTLFTIFPEEQETNSAFYQFVNNPSALNAKTNEKEILSGDGYIKHLEVFFSRPPTPTGQILVKILDVTPREVAHRHLENSREISKAATWSYDVINHKFYCSPELYRIVGLPTNYDALSYETLAELISAETYADLDSSFTKAINEAVPFELKLQKGSNFKSDWFAVMRGKPKFDNQGKVIALFGTFEDVTETELAHQQRTLALERLTLAQSAAHIGVWDYDIKSGLSVWDDQMYTLYGLSHLSKKDHEATKLWEEAVYPEDLPQTLALLTQAVETGGRFDHTFRIILPNGSTKYIHGQAKTHCNSKGESIRLLGINRDVTSQEVSKNKLQILQRQYQALLDYSPVCHMIVDLDNKLRYMNANGFKLMKIPFSVKVYGEKYPFSFFPDNAKSDMKAAIESVKNSGKRYSFESLARDNNLNDMWLFHTVIPVPNEEGKLDYLSVVSADITKRKSLELSILQKEKMEAIGQLAGGIAHDFNNQLATINGFAELISMQAKDIKIKQYADKVLKAGHQSSGLTKQMLAFSRKAHSNMATLKLHEQITQATELFRHTLGKKIVIVESLNASNDEISGEESLIQNVLLNLALNARDAMEQDGQLSIQTSDCDINDDLAKSLKVTPGKYIELTLSDNGFGIEQHTLSRIFEPYFTTKAKGKGTGLGLASVYSMMQQHKGSIEVNSIVGQGTQFHLYFPISFDSSSTSNEIEDVLYAEEAYKKNRILVADDEPDIRELLKETIDLLDGETIAVSDGAEAVHYFRENWQSVDLIILDMQMPLMDGKEAFVAMKEINPDLKAIICTGYQEHSDADELMSLGALEVIAKPFRVLSLAKRLKRLMV